MRNEPANTSITESGWGSAKLPEAARVIQAGGCLGQPQPFATLKAHTCSDTGLSRLSCVRLEMLDRSITLVLQG